MVANSKKNTVITVTVDIQVLKKDSEDHCALCDSATMFTDNRENSTGQRGNGKNFNSKVNHGKRVIWIGNLDNSQSENDFIEILAVAKKDSNQISILKKDVYLGQQGIVEGKVRKAKNPKMNLASKNQANISGNQVFMDYSITFLVGFEESSKMHYKMCTIDPKIRMA